jgi:hypothetical protein
VFVAVVGGIVALIRMRGGKARVRTVRAWIGGKPASSPEYSFSAEGLSHPLRLAFAGFFALARTRTSLVTGTDAAVTLPSLGHISYRAEVLLRLEHHIYRPFLAAAARLSGAVRRTQSGRVAHYVGFLLVVLVLGLAILVL